MMPGPPMGGKGPWPPALRNTVGGGKQQAATVQRARWTGGMVAPHPDGQVLAGRSAAPCSSLCPAWGVCELYAESGVAWGNEMDVASRTPAEERAAAAAAASVASHPVIGDPAASATAPTGRAPSPPRGGGRQVGRKCASPPSPTGRSTAPLPFASTPLATTAVTRTTTATATMRGTAPASGGWTLGPSPPPPSPPPPPPLPPPPPPPPPPRTAGRRQAASRTSGRRRRAPR
ncbi:hypothetical protein I4F81_011750 [Pyropia yezoensis]|uniref:Uncharacterized protein n=1 Tax=Pyropia yezoensis TaxID=2788 RepID=A0ACC3CHL1_PYRYE|nr:hypothetical protein I4F81_011750 [Neopyropia yezoensis]